MQVLVTGKHTDLGDALKQKAIDSLNDVVLKYFDHAVDSHVTIEKKGYLTFVDIEVHVGRNIVLRTSESEDDAYKALEKSIHKLEKNLRRYKDKLKAHHSNHDISKEEQAMQYVLADNYRDQKGTETEGQAAIVAETTTYIPALSVSEAVMRLDLSGNPAFLFKNKTHGQLNMVYVRKDGNIGWVDPEGNKKLHEKK